MKKPFKAKHAFIENPTINPILQAQEVYQGSH
jgi:hypothetical protein